jgi:hypothetical protein
MTSTGCGEGKGARMEEEKEKRRNGNAPNCEIRTAPQPGIAPSRLADEHEIKMN